MNPTPRWRDVVLEQIRIVGLSLRREALVVAVVLGVGTLVIGSEIMGGGPGFDSRETFPTALISFVIPFAVWRNNKPFGPAFLWTLPVDRRRLALAKVFAGLVWTIAALGFFVLWLFVLALVAHAPPMQIVMRVPMTATAAAYLFGSAMVLGLRHPLRWLFGAAGVFYLIGGFSELFGSGSSGFDRFLSSIGFVSTAENAAALLYALPDLARWALATVLSLGCGLLALWAAASRHKETR